MVKSSLDSGSVEFDMKGWNIKDVKKSDNKKFWGKNVEELFKLLGLGKNDKSRK